MKTNPIALAITTFLIGSGSILAAPITWTSSSATTSGSYGQTLDSGLFLSTSVVYAENTGGGGVTFDGVNFSAGTLAFPGGGTFGGFHEGGRPSQTAAFGSSVATITLGSGSMPPLVVGQPYQLQLLLFDGRGSSAGRTVSVDGIDQGVFASGVLNVTYGSGRLVTGTFTADAVTQDFTIECFASGGGSVGSQLNALVLNTVTPQPPVALFAEYRLGEEGSLGAQNLPQDSSGNNRHFASAIDGSSATIATAGLAAPGSTAAIVTSGSGAEGWFSSNLFATLPTDNFALGVYARASANTAATRGNVFSTGGAGGAFTLNLDANGWAASAQNIAYIGGESGVPGSFAPDTWVHLALIRSAGVTTFYLDGVPQAGTYGGTPVHNSPHLSVSPGGVQYFDGELDEARVVTFQDGQSAANILANLRNAWPTQLVNIGNGTNLDLVNLSTDQQSAFRLGGAIEDSAIVSQADGFSVVAGTAPKHVIRITPQGPIAPGTYTLIDYEGSIGGLGFAGLELGSLGRIAGQLVHNTANSSVDLLVTGGAPGDIVWTGANGSVWDLATTTNWVFDGTATPTEFFIGDSVEFNNAAATGQITLAGQLQPAGVVVDNSSIDYVWSGTGGLAGAVPIDKRGTGTLTIANPNSSTATTTVEAGTLRFVDGGALGSGPIVNDAAMELDASTSLTLANGITGSGTLTKSGAGVLNLEGTNSFLGEVLLNEGILKVANSTCLGSVAGATIVAAGASLDLNGFNIGGEPVTIRGAGDGGIGAIVNNGSEQIFAMASLTLADDASIGGTQRWDVRGGGSQVSGDFTLTKIGPNSISFVQSTVTLGDLVVTSGKLSLAFGATLNNTYPGTITVSGGSLAFGDFGFAVICSKPIILDGGMLTTDAPGTDGNASIASPLSLAAPSNIIDTPGTSALSLDGPVSGSGALYKSGSGRLTLTLAPAYAGNTTVVAGTLSLEQAGLGNGSTVDLSGSGILDLAFTGSDAVADLIIDGLPMPDGIYNDSHDSGRFTGAGTLVVGMSGNPYADWETSNGIAGSGSAADSDLDGILNGIEFVIGGDPSGPDSDSNKLPTAFVDATNLTFVFRRTDDSAGFNPFVEYSSTLVGWTVAQGGVGGVMITEDNNFYGANTDRVTVIIPRDLAQGSGLFARLRVNIPTVP